MEEEIDDCLAELRVNGAEVYKNIRNVIDSHKRAETVPFGENENQNSSTSASSSRGSRNTMSNGTTTRGSASTSGRRGNSRTAAKTPTNAKASVSPRETNLLLIAQIQSCFFQFSENHDQ